MSHTRKLRAHRRAASTRRWSGGGAKEDIAIFSASLRDRWRRAEQKIELDDDRASFIRWVGGLAELYEQSKPPDADLAAMKRNLDALILTPESAGTDHIRAYNLFFGELETLYATNLAVSPSGFARPLRLTNPKASMLAFSKDPMYEFSSDEKKRRQMVGFVTFAKDQLQDGSTLSEKMKKIARSARGVADAVSGAAAGRVEVPDDLRHTTVTDIVVRMRRRDGAFYPETMIFATPDGAKHLDAVFSPAEMEKHKKELQLVKRDQSDSSAVFATTDNKSMLVVAKPTVVVVRPVTLASAAQFADPNKREYLIDLFYETMLGAAGDNLHLYLVNNGAKEQTDSAATSYALSGAKLGTIIFFDYVYIRKISVYVKTDPAAKDKFAKNPACNKDLLVFMSMLYVFVIIWIRNRDIDKDRNKDQEPKLRYDVTTEEYIKAMRDTPTPLLSPPKTGGISPDTVWTVLTRTLSNLFESEKEVTDRVAKFAPMIQNQINIVIRTLKPETAAFIRDQTSNFSPTGKRIEVYNYIWAKFYESTKRDSIYYELRNSLQPLLRTGVDYEYSIEQYNWDEFYPDYALGERTATFTSGFRNTGAVISGAFVNTGYALLGSVFNMTGDGSWYDMRKSASGQGIQSLGSTIATGWNQGVEYLGDAAINATLPPAQAAVVAKAKADAKAADAEKAAEAAKAAAKEAEEKRRRTRI